jgi:radical SAM enzyme (TIGR01210 family)
MATPVSPDDLRSQIDEVFRNVNGRDLPYILLTTSGSFLDEREISQELRVYALRLMAKAGLRALSFECRAEFLTDCSRLRAISEAFGGTLQAGIGMESSDPFVRNVILHKGLQDKTILKAVSALRTSGIGYYFYVMVGKPFLTLREDLIDTLKTIEQCFLLDASMVVLETVNIQPHTLTKALYDEGFFTPPSLWMAIEVLSNLPLSQRRMIAVKGFEKAAPTPEVLPDTCPNCRDRVRAAIRDWNLFRDWDRLLDRVGSCSCLEAFKQKLSADLDPTHLSKRVESGLSSLKRRLIS